VKVRGNQASGDPFFPVSMNAVEVQIEPTLDD
jgi:hypothetical protein